MATHSIGAFLNPLSNNNLHPVLGTPRDLEPTGTQEVIFLAAGCFWGVEKIFWPFTGVVSTATGYMGGLTEHPNYPQVCTGSSGHVETVRVVYDTTQISTQQILASFFETHDPTQGNRQGNDRGTQYRSAIWVTTNDQIRIAQATKDAYSAVISAHHFPPITTTIDLEKNTNGFWPAEMEHQAYLWKHPDGYQCHVRTGLACPIFNDSDAG